MSPRSAAALTPVVAGLVVGNAACEPHRRPEPRDSARAAQPAGAAAAGTPDVASGGAGVPAYLQPVFRALDTLLTAEQRDTLRATTVDSTFIYRARRLAPLVDRMAAEWSRMPAGDTLIARGERLPGVMVAIFLDLYQQHVRGETVDLGAALRRMSPEHVSRHGRLVLSVDSVLVRQDLDRSGSPDLLVREVRSQAVDDEPEVADRRLALYLDPAPSGASAPKWATEWSDIDEATPKQALPLAGGGSLLVVTVNSSDACVHTVLHARDGVAREVLRHQIDHGDGEFSLVEKDQRIVATVTGDVQLGGRRVSPAVRCAAREWSGSTVVFDPAARRFVSEGSICVSRR